MADDLNLSLRLGATQDASYRRVIGQAERDIATLDGRQGQLGAGARRGRVGILGATAALAPYALALGATAAAIYKPISAAIDFESTMADVQKVVDFDTPQQFEQMRGDILRLSTELPIAASGLGEIVAAAGQAGIARAELLGFTEDAAKMGVAFDMAAGQAGSAMTGMRSIFDLNQEQVVRLGDAYNHLSNNMDATARDMLNIANRAGSMGDMFGLSGEQIGALGATFLELKTPPEVAGTAINALLLKLATADKQPAKFRDALEALGLSAEDLKDDISQDAQGALLSFLETVERSPDVIGTLSDLFGAEYSDDIAKLVGGLDGYKKALRLVGDETQYAGSMQAEYEARAATTANNLQLLLNEVTRLGVVIGGVLLPPLNWVVGKLADFIGWTTDAALKVPELAAQFRTWATETAGAVHSSMTELLGFDPLTPIQGAWESVTGWLEGFSVSGPAGAVIGTMMGAVIGFNPLGWISARWESTRDWLSQFGLADEGAGIVGKLTTAVVAFNPLGLIVRAWSAVTEWLTGFSLADVGGAVIGGLMDVVRSFDPLGPVRAAWESVTTWLSGFRLSGGTVLDTMTGAVTSFDPLAPIRTAWESVTTWLSGFNLGGGAILDTMMGAVTGFDPLGPIRTAWESVTTWLSGFRLDGGTILDTMIGAVTGFDPLGPIRTAWESVTTWLSGFSLGGGTILDTMMGAVTGFDPLAPIRTAWEAVTTWLSGFNLGGAFSAIESTIEAVCLFNPIEKIRSAWNIVTEWLSGFSLGEAAQSIIGGIMDVVRSFDPLGWIFAAWESVRDWLADFDLGETAQSIVGGLMDAVRSFDPLGWISAAWESVRGWLSGFSLGETAQSIVGGLMDVVRSFDPLGWISAAWESVRNWLADFDLGGAVGEVVNRMVAGISAAWETGQAAAQAVGDVAASAWESVKGWWAGNEEQDPVVGAIITGTEMIVAKLGEVVTAIEARGAPARAAVAAAAIATAAPIAPQGQLPPRALSINVHATINVDSAGASAGALADELRPVVLDIMRQAADEAFDPEADEVEG